MSIPWHMAPPGWDDNDDDTEPKTFQEEGEREWQQ